MNTLAITLTRLRLLFGLVSCLVTGLRAFAGTVTLARLLTGSGGLPAHAAAAHATTTTSAATTPAPRRVPSVPAAIQEGLKFLSKCHLSLAPFS